MAEGDFEANYAYYCLHELGILPSAFVDMDRQEKAFIIACIDRRLEEEKSIRLKAGKVKRQKRR